jgi:phosphate transport system permease protein
MPEWKTMLRVILPAASQGIVTAIMLGVARVAGETAPLVFTAFGNPNLPGSPTGPVAALPTEIWNDAQSPFSDLHQQAWAGAFTLFAIIVILNLIARLLTYRLGKRVALG